jgi:hypothetical protein
MLLQDPSLEAIRSRRGQDVNEEHAKADTNLEAGSLPACQAFPGRLSFAADMLLQDPSVEAIRSRRGQDVNEERAREYHESALRRFVQGRKVAILPDWGGGASHEHNRPAESHA